MATARKTFVGQQLRQPMPETAQVQGLEAFASRPDVQLLLRKLTTELFIEQPADPVQHLKTWLQKYDPQQAEEGDQS
ncbi:hypothetical protein WJX74_010830 [Apatococcus lobatus]|uniref:Uncharacterized protein n=1 Tax=Apatococcus lobatus TaxID=904363 RepID=A0AAW1QC17_9CHLO